MADRHRIGQKLAAAALTAALLLPQTLAVRAAEGTSGFADVTEDAWYAEAVLYCQSAGLMSGTTATTFAPEATLNRAMAAEILYNLAGRPETAFQEGFSDLGSEAWYASSVSWAVEQGLLGGYGGGVVGPERPITREQMAVLFWRYLEQPESEGVEIPFEDAETISEWAVDAVNWAYSQGILTGKDGGVFDPAGQTRRSEAAAMLMRLAPLLESPEEPEEPESPSEPETPELPEEPDTETDPDDPGGSEEPGGGTTSPIRPGWESVPLNEYDRTAFAAVDGFLTYTGGNAASHVGIDVSAYQYDIDWERVAAAGVEFAIIRAGYRGYTQGGIYQDSTFLANIEGALANGIQVGVYFFSQAVTEQEAVEEALWTISWIQDYDITYPVVFDWERVDSSLSRTRDVDMATITACARAFCEVVEAAGYTPMTYGSPNKIGEDLDLSQLIDYPFWLAHYTTGWAPSSFPYYYQMWQYSSNGQVDGIEGRVDLNICLTDW